MPVKLRKKLPGEYTKADAAAEREAYEMARGGSIDQERTARIAKAKAARNPDNLPLADETAEDTDTHSFPLVDGIPKGDLVPLFGKKEPAPRNLNPTLADLYAQIPPSAITMLEKAIVTGRASSYAHLTHLSRTDFRFPMTEDMIRHHVNLHYDRLMSERDRYAARYHKGLIAEEMTLAGSPTKKAFKDLADDMRHMIKGMVDEYTSGARKYTKNTVSQLLNMTKRAQDIDPFLQEDKHHKEHRIAEVKKKEENTEAEIRAEKLLNAMFSYKKKSEKEADKVLEELEHDTKKYIDAEVVAGMEAKR
jgi:hypothetical protein